MAAELILDARNATGESPVWVPAEAALYWVDIPARTIWRWESASGAVRSWSLPEMVGCIAHIDGARWLAGLEHSLSIVTLGDDRAARCEPFVSVRHAAAGMRCNDGRCDRDGRFIVGTMALDMAAALPLGTVTAYGRDDGVRLLASGLITPNGLAFSPEGTTMYLSDSHPNVQAIWAFDYDRASGEAKNRRLFVDMKALPGRPDGAAVDAEGCYWICGNDAGLVHRFTPEGRLDRSLAVPVKKPAMCAFGGADLDTLFVTSIRPALPDEALADQPLAGGLFALNPGVRGVAEPRFRP